jgi:hypothetical protein
MLREHKRHPFRYPNEPLMPVHWLLRQSPLNMTAIITTCWLAWQQPRSQLPQRRMSSRSGGASIVAMTFYRCSAGCSLKDQYYSQLGSKSILAWDLVRYVSLCRWGYLAGYISDTEAWDRIMPAALRLQQTFASWQDMQTDFLIGREFWSMSQSMQTGPVYRDLYERFLRETDSPWNLNPWNMDWNVAAPFP